MDCSGGGGGGSRDKHTCRNVRMGDEAGIGDAGDGLRIGDGLGMDNGLRIGDGDGQWEELGMDNGCTGAAICQTLSHAGNQ